MRLGSNTVLITGGASGIGFALAERFLRAGSRVIVCGRRVEKLREAERRHPQLTTRACDLADQSERLSLRDWCAGAFPEVNVLVNNAGIQHRIELTGEGAWAQARSEIAINLEAVVHLSLLFIPRLRMQPHAAIVNITSALAFAPLPLTPVYSATKAAVHSFTLSLRHQLSGTSIEVVEILPPAVDTDLGGPGLHTFGVPVDELMDAVMPRLEAGDVEIAYGAAEQASRASRAELDQIFARLTQARR